MLEGRAPAYAAAGLGASVGVTDRQQLGATAILASEAAAYAMYGKLQLVRRPTWAVAAQAMVSASPTRSPPTPSPPA